MTSAKRRDSRWADRRTGPRGGWGTTAYSGARWIGLVLLLWPLTACGADDRSTPGEDAARDGAVGPAPDPDRVRPPGTGEWPSAADSIAGTPWTSRDWEIFGTTLREAEARGLDTLPLGDAIAEMGALFLETPYVPRTLEVPGPERLVINFRGLDCVTFVENVLTLTRFQRVHGVGVLDRPEAARALYENDLRALRYRDGTIAGYASRLHYFSEWLAQAEDTGRLDLVTSELGGVEDPEPTDFMTEHRDAYDQLARDPVFLEVQEVERALMARGPRIYLHQDDMAAAEGRIRTGDIIAATSTLPGLDVAHTGIAYRRGGRLHLLHAPLVGSTVVLSRRPLVERIRSIQSQDGIMVARPLDGWFQGGG